MKNMPKLASLSEVKSKIRDGDLLSFQPCPVWYKPWTYWTKLIALTNKGGICHSAMAVWMKGELCCVQMDAAKDRIVLLSSYVNRWPGKIVVSRALVPRGFNRQYAAKMMVRLTERPYGWVRIAILSFARTMTGRLLYPGMSKDCEESKWPPICSEAYSRSMRAAGFDPCEGRADYRTEPHHLFESPKCKPMFRLVP